MRTSKLLIVCVCMLMLVASVGGKKKKKPPKNKNDKGPKVQEDPFCSMSVNCNDINNRNILDGVEYRTSSGKCNNLDNFSWGMAGVQHIRLVSNAYANGRWNPRANSITGTRRNSVPLPTARSVSNAVHATKEVKPDNDVAASLALFYFMQFIDHDITSTPLGTVGKTTDCCSDPKGFCLSLIIRATDNDDFFKTGHCMESRRSKTVFPCNDRSGFQNQFNEITSYIDGSAVYGSSNEEATVLRSFVGGYLKTSTAEFMPEAKDPSTLEECSTDEPAFCFEAGDKRSNVHPSLTSYHTVFVREHNRIASRLGSLNSEWTDEKIFQETRKIVEAEIQHITFNEMLPSMLDSSIMTRYGLGDAFTYDPTQDASIIQAFSIAYRFHHVMPASLHFAEESDSSFVNTGVKNQEDVFHNPSSVFDDNYHGIDQISLGLAVNKCPHVNRMMNDASRNKFVGEVDLAALDIERAREWGTPSYTKYRVLCGLGDARTWSDLFSTHTQEDIDRLQSVYADPRDIDLWTGIVSETLIGTSLSGPTQSCLIGRQFANIRNGDRFWYETRFTSDQLDEIKHVSMGKLLCDNLDVGKMPEKVFNTTSAWLDCGSFAEMDLARWKST